MKGKGTLGGVRMNSKVFAFLFKEKMEILVEGSGHW